MQGRTVVRPSFLPAARRGDLNCSRPPASPSRCWRRTSTKPLIRTKRRPRMSSGSRSRRRGPCLALRPGARVLGADTTVTIDGEILGKPVDEADARRMLRLLNGRPHEVHTGVALVSARGVRSGRRHDARVVSLHDRRRHLVVRRDRGAGRSRRRLCNPGVRVAFHPPDRGLVQQRCRVAGRSRQ